MQCSGGAGATAYRTGRTTAPHPLLFDYSNLTTHYYTHTPPSHYPHTETPIYLVLLFFSISTLTQATIPAPLRRPLPVVDRPRALRSPWNPSSSFLVTESALSTDCTSTSSNNLNSSTLLYPTTNRPTLFQPSRRPSTPSILSRHPTATRKYLYTPTAHSTHPLPSPLSPDSSSPTHPFRLNAPVTSVALVKELIDGKHW